MSATQKIIQDHPFWQSHLSQWRETEQTQAAYCRQHELCPHQFSYYKRKLVNPFAPVKAKAVGFVSVQVQPELSRYDPLTLHFANGMRLSGIAANNVVLVKQLAEVLL